MPPPAETAFEDAIGILRLADKYDVPYLRRRALQHLETIYPTRLSEYDLRVDNTKSTEGTFHCRIATIRTAREVGALWLLPVAYYDVCKRKLPSILENASWLALGEQEKKTCLLGHSAQIQQSPKILKFLTVSKNARDNCADPVKCNRTRLDISFQKHEVMHRNMTWPLDFGATIWPVVEREICDNCVTEAKALHAAAREKFWEELPEMFGLPGWGELEKMRQGALTVSYNFCRCFLYSARFLLL
jgi:hypothetical protein